jgi:hypothetical protein
MRHFLLSLIIAMACAPAYASEDPILASLMRTTDYEPSMVQAAEKSAVVIQNPCPSAYRELDPYPVVIEKLTLNNEGRLATGQWKQTVLHDGCGAVRKLNVWASVDGQTHRLRLSPVLPGVTLADVTLQKDAVKYAVTALRARKSICETGYVYDTAFVNFTGPALPGSKGPPWDEMWTLIYCDIKAEVIMHFIPDKTGTTIAATGAEVTIIPLQ